MQTITVRDIRAIFINKLIENEISENGTIEIINASFIADDISIFGKLNEDYIACELAWYATESRNINNMPCEIPKIWKDIATKDGEINSNYGWCIFSEENGLQFSNAIKALKKDKFSRQSVMIYIRPSMHKDAIKDGMKDFICTFSTQFIIRDNKLHQIVYMRSNDAIFGYKNDRFWHDTVFDMFLEELKEKYTDLEKGNLYWNAGSLHVYPRHFDLVKNYAE